MSRRRHDAFILLHVWRFLSCCIVYGVQISYYIPNLVLCEVARYVNSAVVRDLISQADLGLSWFDT